MNGQAPDTAAASVEADSARDAAHDAARDATRDAARHFERLHRRSADPWDAETSWYERRKRAITVACLPAERFATCFEPGCSIGLLTHDLAARCDAVLAMDVSRAAVERARRRLAGLSNVNVGHGEIPGSWPSVRLDLVVLSEIGYYLAGGDLADVVQRLSDSLAPGAFVVAVHGCTTEPDYLTTPAGVHAALAASPVLQRVASYGDRLFMLDVLERSC